MLFRPNDPPTSTMLVQLAPFWSAADVATAIELSLLAIAKYTRPALSIATAGSLLPEDVPATSLTVQVFPLSSETATAPSLLPLLLQLLFGTYTVPSGATFTCP